MGPLGLLVNNASAFVEDGVLDFDERIWDRHFAIHVKAPAVLASRFAASLPDGAEEGLSLSDSVDSFERSLIAAELRRQEGNIARTAKELRVPKTTLNDKIRKYRLQGE